MVETAKDNAEAEHPEIVDVEPKAPSADAETDIYDSGSAEEPEATPEEPQEEPKADDVAADEEAESPEPEPSPPEPIPDDILKSACAVMSAFTEARPDGYVAKLEASEGEWMTITDDSLSNELERELLTSAAAMCLWQEQMIWYQGENASSFTDAFGKIGPVFVRGRAGQWSIVSQLRSIIRRLWT